MLTYLYTTLYEAASSAVRWAYPSPSKPPIKKGTATDLTDVVLDISKHKKPDGEYEIIIYEVQSIVGSALLPRAPDGAANNVEWMKSFFSGLFLKHTHFVYLPNNQVSFGHPIEPDFKMLSERYGLQASKIIQRLYFNTNRVLQACMPEVVVVSNEDILDPSCLEQLMAGICSKPFVVKREYTSNGEGNTFFDAVDSVEKLREELFLIMCDSMPGVTKGAFVNYLLIEAQESAQSNPDKNHEDVYRAVCVLSKQKQFFNAKIITRNMSAQGDNNSHNQFFRETYVTMGSPVT